MKVIQNLFAIMALCCAGVPVMAQEAWVVLPEQASCLFENLTEYREEPTEPIVIFISVCPVVDRLEAMQAMQQNSGVPRVTVAPNGAPLDEVIVYTQAELDCLASIGLDTSASPVLLPKTPCAR